MKIKISGGFRYFDTGIVVSLILSYISIVRKYAINVIKEIKSTIDKNPWIPNQKSNRISAIPHLESLVCSLAD